MNPILNIAVNAARSAGDYCLRYLPRLDSVKVADKGHNDFVTEADQNAERIIIEEINHHYPGHAILAEESGEHEGREDYCWIIDPLDGTTNFLHGFPVFCVSIAVQHRGKTHHAVVYDPLRQEIFSASRGAGTFLDGRRIRASSRKSLDGALIGTGFPFRKDENNDEEIDAYFENLKAVLAATAGVRRAGAAALDLAYVAAGRLDGFWESNLKLWDLAAGELLITEAGGYTSDLQGEQNHLEKGNICAGGGRVFTELLKLVKQNKS